MAEPACSEECWAAKPCPEHGDQMPPFGRSLAYQEYVCCERYRDNRVNPRHLWHEHDSTRWYTDPDGWAAHEASCDQCKGDPS